MEAFIGKCAGCDKVDELDEKLHCHKCQEREKGINHIIKSKQQKRDK